MSMFPSHLIDPKKKNKEWIGKYVKACWNDFRGVYPSSFYNGRDKYHEIKLYMTGRQPIDKYKKMLDPPKTAGGDDSWLNINWSILPIVPKYRRIALGNLNKTDYNITASAVDPLSQDDRAKYYGDLASRIMLRQELTAAGLDPNMVEIGPNDPASDEELEMHMQYSYKHQMAVEAETAIEMVLKQNDFDEKRKSVIRDLFDFGLAGYREYIDNDGQIKVRRVDPANLVVSYSKLDSMKDIEYAGEVLYMTIADLKQAAGKQFNESEYEDIGKRTQANESPKTRRNLGGDNEEFEGNKIQVLDIEFYSVNQLVTEHRVNSKGNKVVGKAAYNKKNKPGSKKEYKRTDYKVVYTGKWIIGTDYYYDCKLQTNMKRAKSNMTDTTMSYHLFAPDIYAGNISSLGSQMLPIADEIQKAYYKLQNVVIRARPRGIAIDLSSLENINLGRGGTLAPIEIIDFYNQTGNLPWRSVNEDGEGQPLPIQELDNGIGQEAIIYFDIINRNIQLLRDILGFNEITDGSTPDPRTLKGVASMAAQSTNNSLDFIRQAERSLSERLAYNITLRIQDLAKSGKLSGYVKALGSNSMEFFKVDPNITTREIGIFLEDLPNDQEKEQLALDLQKAVDNGQISIADRVAVKAIDNLKLAEKVLAYRVKKFMEMQQQNALQAQQQNAELQQQAALAAEQAKRETLQFEKDLELRNAKAEHQFKLEQINLEGQWDVRERQVDAMGDIEKNKITAQSREITEEMKIENKTPSTDGEG